MYFSTFLINLILMLVVTLVIAALTLIERKFLALNQRRVGPYYVGYRGRLQYIADALKLFIKGVTTNDEANKFWFYAVPALSGLICYFFWVNSVWCPSVSIFDIEYNLVYASLLSVSFSFSIILLGYFSGNKYTRLASIRASLAMLNLELFLGLMILSCVTITESFCFSVFVVYQEYYWFIITFFGLAGIICIIFLMEVGRTPFDLAEAESELVVGYSTEIGGFTFGIFYLGEYFHLFFFSAVVSILFFGGWELPKLAEIPNVDEIQCASFNMLWLLENLYVDIADIPYVIFLFTYYFLLFISEYADIIMTYIVNVLDDYFYYIIYFIDSVDIIYSKLTSPLVAFVHSKVPTYIYYERCVLHFIMYYCIFIKTFIGVKLGFYDFTANLLMYYVLYIDFYISYLEHYISYLEHYISYLEHYISYLEDYITNLINYCNYIIFNLMQLPVDVCDDLVDYFVYLVNYFVYLVKNYSRLFLRTFVYSMSVYMDVPYEDMYYIVTFPVAAFKTMDAVIYEFFIDLLFR